MSASTARRSWLAAALLLLLVLPLGALLLLDEGASPSRAPTATTTEQAPATREPSPDASAAPASAATAGPAPSRPALAAAPGWEPLDDEWRFEEPARPELPVAPGQVSGLVLDEQRRPLAGVRLRSARGSTREVGCDGWAPQELVLDGLDAGRHTLLVDAPGWRPRALEVDLAPGQRRDLGDVALERGAVLELEVLWPDAPLAGVELAWTEADGPRTERRSPSGGSVVAFEALPPGRFSGTLTAIGVDGRRWSAEVGAELAAERRNLACVDLRGTEGR